MLRITVIHEKSLITLKLEGKLTGPWVRELQETWRASVPKGKRLIVDLTAVSVTDEAGADLFALMRAEGAELIGEDPLMGYTLQQTKEQEERGKSPKARAK